MNSAIAIGGGLAGAAFALELARSGYRVTVVEKAPAAHHKVCGEFLSAEAQRLITYLGLDVWALGATPARKLQLACRQASTTLELPFLGAGLSRFRLDEALLRAAEAAGAEIVRGATVTRLEWTEQSVTVRASGQEFRAVHA